MRNDSYRATTTIKMPDNKCSVKSCQSVWKKNSEIKFYSLPSLKKNLKNPSIIKVTSQRREAWIRVLGHEEPGNNKLFVCSLHFSSGMSYKLEYLDLINLLTYCFQGSPSELFDLKNVDWVPNILIEDTNALMSLAVTTEKKPADDEQLLPSTSTSHIPRYTLLFLILEIKINQI